MKSLPKIFITGGHLTPAKAMIDIFMKKNWKIWYIGRKFAQEEDKSLSVEYNTIKSLAPSVKLLVIYTGKMQRYLSIKSFLSFFKIPFGFLQSLYWVIKYRPDIILSFGGYVSIPLCIAGRIFGIPIITHEQTRAMGLSNKFLNLISNKVCVSWKDLVDRRTFGKIIYTGLPLRMSIFKAEKNLAILINKPLLYLTGGSLGSHSINNAFAPIISSLLTDFAIIHQCGETQKYSDYEKFIELKKNLQEEVRKRYLPIYYIQEKNLGWVYQRTAFTIGRSGANTVYELASLGIPALFIPLPFASG
ncbi:MAG: glycosyltransferase, partial [Patescibacteria group bacterium]|nr:glycosyltransferase [Patescibacteria group bacterium]